MGSSMNRCRETIATCERFSNRGHNKVRCASTNFECYHCKADHHAFSRNCPKFSQEVEITQIQTRKCIAKLQTIRKFLRLNPNPEFIFSKVVKNTSDATILKSLISFEQESESDASIEVINESDTSESKRTTCWQTLKFNENLSR